MAFVGGDPVYKSLRAELVEMVGPQVYKMLVAQLERPVPLPHPVFRKRVDGGNRKTTGEKRTTPVQG
jgi:hypothetical protein